MGGNFFLSYRNETGTVYGSIGGKNGYIDSGMLVMMTGDPSIGEIRVPGPNGLAAYPTSVAAILRAESFAGGEGFIKADLLGQAPGTDPLELDWALCAPLNANILAYLNLLYGFFGGGNIVLTELSAPIVGYLMYNKGTGMLINAGDNTVPVATTAGEAPI